ncbi:MAG: peptidylprolyl isomerase [Bacteroidales bacterium]|nr:peptidylprolyl isomerase [Bacteroidales bacterium]
MDNEKEIHVLIKTPYGNMKAKLYNKTPKHRDNFVKLVKEGWYKSSPFHRVIKRFMVQGGQKGDGTEDIGYTIPAEFVPEYIHKKGALAAARTADQINPQKASSGNQFYIVQGKTSNDAELDMLENRQGFKYTPEQRKMYKTVGGTSFLDYNYTVFGEVYEGLEVIDKIAAVKTGNMDKPIEDVRMDIEIIQQ